MWYKSWPNWWHPQQITNFTHRKINRRNPNRDDFVSRCIQIRRPTSGICRVQIGIFVLKATIELKFQLKNAGVWRRTQTHTHHNRYRIRSLMCAVRGSTVCFSAVTFSVPYRRHHHWMQSGTNTSTFAHRKVFLCSPPHLICLPLSLSLSLRLYIRARSFPVNIKQQCALIDSTIIEWKLNCASQSRPECSDDFNNNQRIERDRQMNAENVSDTLSRTREHKQRKPLEGTLHSDGAYKRGETEKESDFQSHSYIPLPFVGLGMKWNFCFGFTQTVCLDIFEFQFAYDRVV